MNSTASTLGKLSGCTPQRLPRLLRALLLVKTLRTGVSHAFSCWKVGEKLLPPGPCEQNLLKRKLLWEASPRCASLGHCPARPSPGLERGWLVGGRWGSCPGCWAELQTAGRWVGDGDPALGAGLSSEPLVNGWEMLDPALGAGLSSKPLVGGWETGTLPWVLG